MENILFEPLTTNIFTALNVSLQLTLLNSHANVYSKCSSLFSKQWVCSLICAWTALVTWSPDTPTLPQLEVLLLGSCRGECSASCLLCQTFHPLRWLLWQGPALRQEQAGAGYQSKLASVGWRVVRPYSLEFAFPPSFSACTAVCTNPSKCHSSNIMASFRTAKFSSLSHVYFFHHFWK